MPNEQKETLLCRTEMLLGREGMQKLAQAHVAVFGIGGVGSFAAEALIRSGIGAVTLVDKDTVSLSNCNRQLIATQKTCLLYTSPCPPAFPPPGIRRK